jgi:hypothetical protein
MTSGQRVKRAYKPNWSVCGRTAKFRASKSAADYGCFGNPERLPQERRTSIKKLKNPKIYIFFSREVSKSPRSKDGTEDFSVWLGLTSLSGFSLET